MARYFTSSFAWTFAAGALLLSSLACGAADIGSATGNTLAETTVAAVGGGPASAGRGATAGDRALPSTMMVTSAPTRAMSTTAGAGARAAAPSAGQPGSNANSRVGSAGSTAGTGAAAAGVDAAAGSGRGGAGMSAASAGAGGLGNAAPAGSFAPCPMDEACRILPLGDSITDGIGFSGGYRVELFRKARADGKKITFVGGSANGPNMVDNVMFPRNHEGHSGWTVAQIDSIVPDPALSPMPHVVLLHIGTNDMYQGAKDAPARLDMVIGQITKELPQAMLVVAKIIPLPNATGAVNTFNGEVAKLVAAHAGAGEHVLLVDQFTGFPTSELGDGVHPNEAGYARMAEVWYEAIRDVLR